ncbi:MAG: DUF2147 domain-containing protein [Pseudomonadota bacterium]
MLIQTVRKFAAQADGHRRPTIVCCLPLVVATLGANVLAGTAQDAHGLWLSGDKAAVIQFAPCADTSGALCGKIVWDKDANTPADACGMTIAKLMRYEDDAWRNGWVLDPRTNKHYKGALRVRADVLNLRAYIGTELLGETEQMTRVQTLPAGCKAQPQQVPS